MDVKYAILGFLSWQPLSGYDLKKMVSGSDGFYWSGNNNQIYTSLVQLLREGLVTHEVQQQERFPARKIYTITDQGLAELRLWVSSSPEAPQIRNSFLAQLAWADRLKPEELDSLLSKYEYEVEMQYLMHCEHSRRKTRINPARTPRESFLWEKISENLVKFYQSELAWVRQIRKDLQTVPDLK
jgi:PadR family transcriptional regulator AphA